MPLNKMCPMSAAHRRSALTAIFFSHFTDGQIPWPPLLWRRRGRVLHGEQLPPSSAAQGPLCPRVLQALTHPPHLTFGRPVTLSYPLPPPPPPLRISSFAANREAHAHTLSSAFQTKLNHVAFRFASLVCNRQAITSHDFIWQLLHGDCTLTSEMTVNGAVDEPEAQAV